jgi:hypothetical protein
MNIKKVYYEKNKEKIRIINKEKYNQNKFKIPCNICNLQISKVYYSKHLKTSKHIYNFNKQ